MDYTHLIKVRALLDEIWKKALLRGRCRGPEIIRSNPFAGSNITLAEGKELVSICVGKDGALRIHEFTIASKTSLGEKVKAILRKNSIPLEKPD